MSDDIDALVNGLTAAPGGGPPAPAPAAPAPGGNDIDALVSGLTASPAPSPAPKAQPKAPAPAPVGRGSPQPLNTRIYHYEGDGKEDPNSHAVYGFLPSTWNNLVRKYEPDLLQGRSPQQVLDLRKDPATRDRMFDRVTQENTQALNGKVPINDANLYGAWWLGPTGMLKAASADPSTPMDQLFGTQTARNNGWLKTDKTGAVVRRDTVGDFRNTLSQRMNADNGSNLTWGEVPGLAAQNFGPSVKRAAGEAYEGAKAVAADPVGTAKNVIQGVGALGNAADSYVEDWTGTNKRSADERTQAEAPIRNIVQDYARAYGPDLKQTLAYDPVRPLLDASMVTPVGEAGAARLAGGLGKLAETAGETSTVGKALDFARQAAEGSAKAFHYMDPMNLVRAPLDMVAPTGFKPLSGGAPTAEFDQAVRAATNGGMGAADIMALPKPQLNKILKTVKQKGFSSPAILEGLHKAFDLDAPASILTGEAPSELARAKVEGMKGSNMQSLGDAARGMSGAAGPSETELAEKVAQAQAANINGIRGSYDTAATAYPGSFGPALNGGQLLDALAAKANAMSGGTRPFANGQALARYIMKNPKFTQSQAALKDMYGVLAQRKYNFPLRGRGVDAPELMQLRRNLTDYGWSANGEDASIMKALTEGYQDHIQDLSSRGLFRDASGAPVNGFMDAFKAANDAYADHMNTFHAGPFKGAIDAIGNTTDPATGLMTANTDLNRLQAAQPMLADNLLHPAKGADHYNRLSKVLKNVPGGQQALDNYLRQLVFETDDAGLLRSTKKVHAALQSPTSAVAKAFAQKPAQLAQAKAMHALQRQNARAYKRGSQRRATLSGLTGKVVRLGAKVAAGYAGEKLGKLPGFMLSMGLEHAAEKGIDAWQVAHELKGATVKRGVHGRAAQLARAAANPYLIQAARANAERPGHASGGKVESHDERVERLVGRLMSMAQSAKKQSNAATEPLLQQPDEAIVKALAVAQRAI